MQNHRFRKLAGAAIAVIAVVVFIVASRSSYSPESAPTALHRVSAEVPRASSIASEVTQVSQQRHDMPAESAGVNEPVLDEVVSVTFPSGESVDVLLSNFRPAIPGVPYQSSIVAMYDDLVASANSGDAAAARELHNILEGCKSAFQAESEMNAEIERLRETGTMRKPGLHGEEHVHVGVDTAPIEENIRSVHKLCKGVSQAQMDEASHWLKVAVDAGNYLATRDYAQQLGLSSSEGVDVYRKLWNQGHLSAGNSLAVAYQRGFDGVGGEANQSISYAYALAVAEVRRAALNRSASSANTLSPQIQNRLKSLDDMLAMKAAYLSPSEQEAAVQFAIKLLRENEDCCKGMWAAY